MVNKDTVNNHVLEMQNLGLVEIRHGKYGGILWSIDEISSFKALLQEKIYSLFNNLQWGLSHNNCFDSITNTIQNAITDIQRIISFLESA